MVRIAVREAGSQSQAAWWVANPPPVGRGRNKNHEPPNIPA